MHCISINYKEILKLNASLLYAKSKKSGYQINNRFFLFTIIPQSPYAYAIPLRKTGRASCLGFTFKTNSLGGGKKSSIITDLSNASSISGGASV